MSKFSQPEKPSGNKKITKTKDMTPLDEITHNFTGDPTVRAYFIEKYGQCFEDGIRHTAEGFQS